MYLLSFKVLLDGQRLKPVQDLLEVLGPYSVDDAASTISSLDRRQPPRLVLLGLEYVPNTFRCTIRLLKRPMPGSKEEKSVAVASSVALRILSWVHFLVMNISPLLTLFRVLWFIGLWLIVALELLFFGTLEWVGLPLRTSLPKLEFVLQTELDKKTCLFVRLKSVPRAFLPSLETLRKTWKLGFRFLFDFDFDFDCEVVQVAGTSIKLVMDSSCVLPTLDELVGDMVAVVAGEYASGKKQLAAQDGSRTLFALTVAGQRLDVRLREVVVSASVYFKLKGYIDSHMQAPSRAHGRTYSVSTAATETTFTEMNPLMDMATDADGLGARENVDDDGHGAVGTGGLNLASLVAAEFADVFVYDQDDRCVAEAAGWHLSSSTWYPSAAKAAGPQYAPVGKSNYWKVTYYHNKYPAKSEVIAQVDRLSVYAVPGDLGHRVLLEGLSLLYSSSANSDASLSKLMTTSGSALDVQCRSAVVETSEAFLDHCLGELPLRTIRYFCFGAGYLWESLLAEVEVSCAVDDVAVEVLCARPGEDAADAGADEVQTQLTYDSIYGGDGNGVDTGVGLCEAAAAAAAASMAGAALYTYRVEAHRVEYDVPHPRALASFRAEDLQACLLELSVPARGGKGDAEGEAEVGKREAWAMKEGKYLEEHLQALLWAPE